MKKVVKLALETIQEMKMGNFDLSDKVYDKVVNAVKLDADMPRVYSHLTLSQQKLVDLICEECYNSVMIQTKIDQIEKKIESINLSVATMEETLLKIETKLNTGE